MHSYMGILILVHFFLQALFFVYMVLVTLLLVNMLIAMMGNTFSTIASTEKEWQRQVGVFVYLFVCLHLL